MSTPSETWLVPPNHRVPTPFSYGGQNSRIRPVDCAIVHWTATPPHKAHQHRDDPARIIRWLSGSGRESSTHFIVTRAGEVFQGAPLEWRAWHSGGSRTPDGRDGVNYRSIAFDLENVGNLDEEGGTWADSYGSSYRGPVHRRPTPRNAIWARPTPAHHAPDGWEPYRVAQIVAFFSIAKAAAAHVPVLSDPGRWFGHCEIRATKLDPGPHFPWTTLGMVLDGHCEPGEVGGWHPTDRKLAVDE